MLSCRCLRFSLSSLMLASTMLLACGDDDAQSTAADESTGEDDASGDESGETGSELAPTWYQDIAPIVHDACGGCHREGGIAPFSMDSYETAAMWSPLMVSEVEAGNMPPFGAASGEECEPPHSFKDDPRLSEDDEALLRAWAEAGAPEGDPTNPADLPDLESTALEDPDLNLPITAQVEVEAGEDRFVCFVVDPEVADLRFLAATQVNPGNDKIVHHVLVYSTPDEAVVEMAGEDGFYECFGGIGTNDLSLVSAWAPGVQPARFPQEAPGVIQAGEKLVINVHYHPTGGTEMDDSTSIDIKWHEGLPEYVSQLLLIGNAGSSGAGLLPGENDEDGVVQFRIPAGAESHREEMQFTLPGSTPELKLWMVGSHMHYAGTDMLIGVLRPEESELENGCLLHTPHYDFNWQRGYVYDVDFEDAPIINPGDAFRMRCEYNNSLTNPLVAEALAGAGLSEPDDVYLGETTFDEMCLGIFGVAAPLAEFLP